MSRLIKFLFLFLFFTIFTGCQKDDESDPDIGKITCKVDGEDWVSTDNEISMFSSFIEILGTNGTETLNLGIGGATTGTYNLKNGSGNEGSLGNILGLFSTNYVVNSKGNVTITEINVKDSTLSATFSFEAINGITGKKITITEGKINKVKFVKNNITGNILSAVINGKLLAFIPFETYSDNTTIIVGGDTFFFEDKLSLTFDKNLGPGTYELKQGTKNFARYTNGLSSPFGSISKSGQLIITLHDKTAKYITGSFSFKAKDDSEPGLPEIVATDGNFSFNY